MTSNVLQDENLKSVVLTDNEDLQPTKERFIGNLSYYAMWTGGCIAIAVFATGSSLLGTLNLFQAIMALVVGTVMIAIGLVINGRAGHVYGIPYTVQIRSSFGFMGAKIPGLARALPALVWFGFQSWVGAEAINMVFYTMFGFDNVALCFILFQILQICLTLYGFKGIKWLENVATVFIIIALVYMFITVINKYGMDVVDNVINIQGSWGLPFWGGVLIFVGQYSTMMLNVSDYSRQFNQKTGNVGTGSIYWLAVGPSMMFMALIGLIVSGATGSYDPITVFSSAIDNPVLLVMTLLFIIFAQISTNVLNNFVPPVYVLMDAFKKVPYKAAVVIIGVLAVCTFPWILISDTSADGLALFIKIYAAFLGPCFAIMAIDYHVFRKGKLNIKDYYDQEGPFKGINWAGIIAMGCGAIVGLFEVNLTWFASAAVGGIVYFILMKYTGLGKSFITGTVLEKNK